MICEWVLGDIEYYLAVICDRLTATYIALAEHILAVTMWTPLCLSWDGYPCSEEEADSQFVQVHSIDIGRNLRA